MLRRVNTLLLTALLCASTALTAQAFTTGVIGPTSLQNGYPVWWQDDAGFRVGLCLEGGCFFDPAIAGNAFSQQVGFGPEAFWWLAEASTDECNALLVLGMEAAWAAEVPRPGDQFPFGRIRIRADTTAAGPHTIVTPFNTIVVDAAAGTRGINFSADIFGLPTETPPFVGALASDITHFFRVTAPDPAPGGTFLGTGTIASAGPVNGSTFSITGPGCNTTTTTFTVASGLRFNDGPNLAPVANHDIKATQVATPLTINLTANDVDLVDAAANVHGINPRAVGLGAAPPFVFEPGDPANATTRGMATTQGGRVAKNSDGTVTYLPAAAFSGVDTFAYVIQDTGGCISGQIDCSPAALGTPQPPTAPPAAQPPVPALAIVTVEQATAQASFRPKLHKWDISGTSSVAALTTTEPVTNDPVLFTNLSGIQEVPPRASAGTGDASVTLRPGLDGVLGTADDLIDYTLTFSGLVAVQQAHIHSGPVGANGPVNVFLCTNIGSPPEVPAPPACPETAGTVTGTLSAADFIIAGAVETFPQLIAAIQAGGTYVNVHTVQFGGGELRGQLGRNVVAAFSGPNTAGPLLGVTAVPDPVGQAATWSLPEKLSALPSTDRTVTIQTSAGNTVTVPLRLK